MRAELNQTDISAPVICPEIVPDGSMFATHIKTAPGMVGESWLEAVANVAVRTIQRNFSKIIVKPKPIWPVRLLDIIHPDLGPWVLRKAGVHAFYRQLAEGNKRFLAMSGRVYGRK